MDFISQQFNRISGIRIPLIIGASIFLLATSACEPTQEPPTKQTTTPVATVPTATLEPTGTPAPTRLLFLAPGDEYQEIEARLLDEIRTLVGGEGWKLEIVDHLPEDTLSEGVRVIVALPSDIDLGQYASNHEDIQFVAIGYDIEPQMNLSIIGPDGFSKAPLSFLAGYLSAVITADWRVGILTSPNTDSPGGSSFSFRNGVVYYCGLCRLTYPPFYNYPINLELDASSSQLSWQRAADEFVARSVKTLFVDTMDLDRDVLQGLAEKGMIFIGGRSTPPELVDHWVATIRWAPERILREKWSQLIDGLGGWSIDTPLIIDEINADLLSEGRQRWVEAVLDDLNLKYIDPGSAP
jgi:hypothetical protein